MESVWISSRFAARNHEKGLDISMEMSIIPKNEQNRHLLPALIFLCVFRAVSAA